MNFSALVAAGAALFVSGLDADTVPSPAPMDCPESGLRQVSAVQWFLRNPNHEPDRMASGIQEGLKAFGPTLEYDDWQYINAEPLADPNLCKRVAIAVEAAQLERPADWEWGFFRVEDRIFAVHTRPSSDVRIDGRGPRTVAYVLDPGLLDADRMGEAADGRAVVSRFEARWWNSSPK